MKLNEIILEYTRPKNITDLYLIMTMPEPSSKAGKFITKEIVTQTRNDIQKEMEGIVLGELSHWADMTREGELLTEYLNEVDNEGEDSEEAEDFLHDLNQNNTLKKLMDKTGANRKYDHHWLNLGHALSASYKFSKHQDVQGFDEYFDYVKRHYNIKMTPGIIEWVYNQLGWDSDYGGPPWAKITKAVTELREASGAQFLFDRTIDLVHNTGSLLDKFRESDKIKPILDIKAHAIDPRELYKHSSRDIQRLFRDPNWQKYYYAHVHPHVVDIPGRLTKGRKTAVQKSLRTTESGAPIVDVVLRYGHSAAVELEYVVKYFGLRPVLDALEKELIDTAEELRPPPGKKTTPHGHHLSTGMMLANVSAAREQIVRVAKHIREHTRTLERNIANLEQQYKEEGRVPKGHAASKKQWEGMLKRDEQDLARTEGIEKVYTKVINHLRERDQ